MVMVHGQAYQYQLADHPCDDPSRQLSPIPCSCKFGSNIVDHQWDIVFRGPKKTRKGAGLSCLENASYIDYGYQYQLADHPCDDPSRQLSPIPCSCKFGSNTAPRDEYVVDHQWDIVFRGPKKTRKGAGLSCLENASYIVIHPGS
jgi:hypothetical protein